MKNNKGITLIVLSITIGIMITLAAVTISYIVGEESIIGKAEEISKEQEKENKKEDDEMVISALEMAVVDINLESASIESLQENLGDEYQVLDDIEDENKFLIWDKEKDKILYLNKDVESEGEVEIEKEYDIKIIDSKDEFNWSLNDTTGKINGLKYKNKDYEGTVIFPTYVIVDNKAYGINNIPMHDSYKFSEVILPKKMQTSTQNTFKNCTNLKKVTIGYIENGITAKMFSGCTSLENIIFKSQEITKILYYAFENCSSLKEIRLPESIKSIGTYAFKGCSSLEEINLPESITGISAGLFIDCTNLKRIYIGKNIKTIVKTALNGCTALEEIQIDKTAKEIMEITNIESLLTEIEFTKVKIYDKDGTIVQYIEEE